jgi:hypothetical protein
MGSYLEILTYRTQMKMLIDKYFSRRNMLTVESQQTETLPPEQQNKAGRIQMSASFRLLGGLHDCSRSRNFNL